MEINKVALKAFYEARKDEYWRRRNSGNSKLWDEQYKWNILPRLNRELSKYDSVTSENVVEVSSILTHHKNTSNFANWRDIGDLKPFLERRNASKVIDVLWQAKPDNVASEINSANAMTTLFMSDKKFTPSTWAYILAARNCDSFSLYREPVMKKVAEICGIDRPSSAKQGEKYALLNNAALYLGEIMKPDASEDNYLQALNGQDFLWVVFMYNNQS